MFALFFRKWPGYEELNVYNIWLPPDGFNCHNEVGTSAFYDTHGLCVDQLDVPVTASAVSWKMPEYAGILHDTDDESTIRARIG